MPTPAEQFRIDIEAIKDAIAGIVATAAPKARVIKRFVYDMDADNWLNLLKSSNDLDANGKARARSVHVYYQGLTFNDPDFSSTVGAINPLLPFGLSFYHGYDIGTDADNSEERLMDDIANVTWALADSTDLGVRPLVKGHHNLRVPEFRMHRVLPLWHAAGELNVLMQSRQI